MAEARFTYPHHTDPDIFREALSYSEGNTGFTANLIEKDYYCSLILQYLFSQETQLIFKGGTCLSKVYADFYRLSEDLDFVVPVAVNAKRNQRRHAMDPLKGLFDKLTEAIPGIAVSKGFGGHNESRQYIGQLEYPSAVIDRLGRVKIEVGFREPLILPSVTNGARTIAVNPFSGRSLIPVFPVQTMDMMEAYAEKVRAALTRPEPAIRDLFDLFYAVRKMNLDLVAPDFLLMVKKKLNVPGNIPIDISLEYKQELARQIDGQLRPVLRPTDFNSFNLDEAFELVLLLTKGVLG
jgi:predicted nucleotidyltransferase component of viral defense system